MEISKGWVVPIEGRTPKIKMSSHFKHISGNNAHTPRSCSCDGTLPFEPFIFLRDTSLVRLSHYPACKHVENWYMDHMFELESRDIIMIKQRTTALHPSVQHMRNTNSCRLIDTKKPFRCSRSRYICQISKRYVRVNRKYCDFGT